MRQNPVRDESFAYMLFKLCLCKLGIGGVGGTKMLAGKIAVRETAVVVRVA